MLFVRLEAAMVRRVVRVEFTHTYEYDVVFDDGVPVYVGAVIKRPGSMKGPNAGKIIDTHRTNWHSGHPDGGKRLLTEPAWGSPGHTATIVQRAASRLEWQHDAEDDPPVPVAATRPKRMHRRR